MNATIEKFGYPATLVAEYRHWVVLARPKQATLGAQVLASREEATTFGALSSAAFQELAEAIPRLEQATSAAFACARINYLMLMMVDPHVHFHVLPRYGETRQFEGYSFEDPGWPGPPHLGAGAESEAGLIRAVRDRLREHWPPTGA